MADDLKQGLGLDEALPIIKSMASEETRKKSESNKAAEAQILSQEGLYSKPAPDFKPSEESASGFAALGALLAASGAILGSGGRSSGLMAMNAVAGMMNGYNAGRKDLYEQERQKFEESMKSWEKNRALIKDAFDRAMKIAPTNLKLAQESLNRDLISLGQKPLAEMVQRSGPMPAAAAFYRANDNTTTKLSQLSSVLGTVASGLTPAQKQQFDSLTTNQARVQFLESVAAQQKTTTESKIKEIDLAIKEKQLAATGKWVPGNYNGKNVYYDPSTKQPVRDDQGNVIEVATKISSRYGAPLDDAATEELAQKVANLSLDPKTLTPADRDKVLVRASQINPNYNQGDYGNTNLAYRQWTTPNGAGSKQLASFSVAAQHLDALEQYAKALQNNDVQLANAMKNKLSVALGHEEVTDFNTARQAVAAEIVRAITASAGAKSDRQEAENAFNSNASPDQIQGAINVSRRLIGSRLDTARAQFKIGTKRKDEDFDALLPPEVQNNFGVAPSKSSVPSDVTTSGWQ
jgi:hypothetical protein